MNCVVLFYEVGCSLCLSFVMVCFVLVRVLVDWCCRFCIFLNLLMMSFVVV